jgi:hypothetical protein
LSKRNPPPWINVKITVSNMLCPTKFHNYRA